VGAFKPSRTPVCLHQPHLGADLQQLYAGKKARRDPGSSGRLPANQYAVFSLTFAVLNAAQQKNS